MRAGKTSEPQVRNATVVVDCGADKGRLDRIWTSLGYDEINWTYTPAGKHALRTIGDFAERSYYVRPHYIFCSGTGFGLPHWGQGNVYHEDDSGTPFFDFTIADQVYDTIVGAGHRPLVELAFTPRALVPDYAESDFLFERSPTQYSAYEAGLWAYPPKDYAKWTALVRALVEHCVGRYQKENVETWLWELWNEPDINYWRGTPDQFYDLYEVTVEAVKTALPTAQVGGPATTGGSGGATFLRGFLRACADRQIPLDFVSFHTKGAHFSPWRTYGPTGGPPPVRQSPSVLKMIREIIRSRSAVEETPEFRKLPCYVDECDASVPAHWGFYDNANFRYRNTEYYPVFQCKLMKKLLDLNENSAAKVAQATTWSFYFEGERYFEGTRSLFTASGIEKPVLNAYRMFALLGDTRLEAQSSHAWTVDRVDEPGSEMPEEVDALATRDEGGRASVLVWRHADDQYQRDTEPATVRIRLSRLGVSRPVLVRHWRIDADHSNSHTAWQTLGEPQDPSPEQLSSIRARQCLERYEPDQELEVTDGNLELLVHLPLPSVSLLDIEEIH